MTGATHSAIAIAIGMLAGCPKTALMMLAGGALLPDIDHPQSTVGRIFFPISIPISNMFGHRGAVHSFWLWSLVAACGIFTNSLFYVGVGALLHIAADCATISGVRAMTPFSDRVFVMFKREWRVRTGGRGEFAILMVVGTIAWLGGKISQTGGIAAAVGALSGSPKIMVEEYRAKGLRKCWVKGKVRWLTGQIEEGRWLIIGSVGSSGIAFERNGAIIHIPEQGRFMKARLEVTESSWLTMDLKGWLVTEFPCYFISKGKWHKALQGDVVFGRIIGDKLVLTEPIDNISLNM